MYKNLKTRTKILIGFLLMLVMLLIIVIFSLLEINTLGDELSVYPDKMLPNVSSVWSVRRDIASTQRYVLRAIASRDSAEIKEAVDMASEDGAHIQQTLETYKTTSTADPALVKKLEDALTETRKAREELAPHILANTEEEDVIAFEYYDTVYKPISDSAAQIAVELYDDQIAFAKDRVAEAQRIERGCFILNIVLSVVSIAIAIVISIVSARIITAPIHDIEAVVSKMAVGDFSSEITYVSSDEIGQLAANCSKMEHTVTTIVRDMGEMLSALAKGDFTIRSSYEGAYIGEYNPLIKDMYILIDSLSDTLSQINQSADQVANGSEQVSIGAQSLSQGSVQQASSVQELSATISDISGKIKHTSENAQLAKKLSGDSSESLEISKKKMDEMISAMNDISSSSNEINKIIKTIDDIAFQTNILSLNAAVEAARAGAAGKGFAVVADEVRTLAQKSAEAVQSTTTMIESTIEAVANGTKIVDATAESIFDVVERTKKVVDVIDNIAADAEEQADAISQITVGVDQISSVVQTNSATSEESAAASEELSGQADGLKSLISTFRLGGSRR